MQPTCQTAEVLRLKCSQLNDWCSAVSARTAEGISPPPLTESRRRSDSDEFSGGFVVRECHRDVFQRTYVTGREPWSEIFRETTYSIPSDNESPAGVYTHSCGNRI